MPRSGASNETARLPLGLLLSGCVALFGHIAQAQAEASPAASPDGTEITPPLLVRFVDAAYPPEALAQGREAEVTAQIDIDETGAVTAVEIVGPAGQGFDEAAAAAIRRFVFAPARQGDEPVPARILYRYRFFQKEAPPPSEAPPPRCALEGRVLTVDDAPVPEASVFIALAEDPADGAKTPPAFTTGADGAFYAADLPCGAYRVDVTAAGFEPLTSTEDLETGETRELVYRLAAEAALYETVVRDRRPPREVTRREITQKEILRMPGAGGDALRAVMNMPGTARPAFDNGEIIIRGSKAEDSQVFIDSMPVPLLFHFGGLTSVVNADLIERIDYYPGNFSVRYGDAIGGIVDATLRAPRTDRLHVSLDADVWDVSALVETPIGKEWSVAASVRRSYIDGILKHIDTGDMQFTVLPRYWDYQLVVDHHPSAADDLRLTVFGSDDTMEQIWGASSSDEPAMEGQFGMHVGFHRANLTWSHEFNRHVSNRATLGAGYFIADTEYGGAVSEKIDLLPFNLRDELTIDPGRYAVFRTGLDIEYSHAWAEERVPMDYTSEGEEEVPWGANTQFMEFDAQGDFARPGWFGEIELTAVPRTRIITGLRLDYYTYTRDVGVDPRAAARFQLTDSTVLKAGLGLFHQVGEIAEIYEKYGNRDLKLIFAIHYAAGVEQSIADRVDIDVEGFYKDLSRMIVTSDEMIERGGELVPERFNNDGVGRVWGLEVEIKHRPIGPFFGWISYTLMKSERRDHPGEAWRRFDNDQTHILTVVGSVELPWNMSAGLRFRLASGNPDTPVEGAVFDSDSDLYVPIYGKPNSARMPMFHQLDLRVDKKWQWKYLALSVYVDVENVYNRKNPEMYLYNFNYTKKGYIYGLPIIPSLGIRLEY